MLSPKRVITFGMVVGGFVGGWVPALWGASGLSMSAVACSTLGALAGVWLGWKLTR